MGALAALPVDADFFHAFVGSAVALPAAFTPGWEEAWEAIAASEQYPGAFERWRRFKKEEGIETLNDLAKRKANPNFFLCCLVKYLWRDDIPDQNYNFP